MPLYLLDTNIVLHLVRGDTLAKFIEEEYQLKMEKIRPAISIVSCGEIWSLAEQKNWGIEKRKVLKEVMESLTIIDINIPEVIKAYVEIDIASQKHPDGSKNMGKNDIWIAACTKVTQAILITTDKDFDHLHPDQIQRIWVNPKIK